MSREACHTSVGMMNESRPLMADEEGEVSTWTARVRVGVRMDVKREE